MKPLLISALCFFSICVTSCHKPSKPPSGPAAHTDGMGGMRNWHVYIHSSIHRSMGPDSAYFHDTAYWLLDQSFALNVFSADTVELNNTKYFFHHSSDSVDVFRIWHTQLSGNPSSISHDLDSNKIIVYRKDISVSSTNEQWYYSF